MTLTPHDGKRHRVCKGKVENGRHSQKAIYREMNFFFRLRI